MFTHEQLSTYNKFNFSYLLFFICFLFFMFYVCLCFPVQLCNISVIKVNLHPSPGLPLTRGEASVGNTWLSLALISWIDSSIRVIVSLGILLRRKRLDGDILRLASLFDATATIYHSVVNWNLLSSATKHVRDKFGIQRGSSRRR